ncbi:hypothetical protein, partial [Enterococcus camelliae]
QFRLTHHAQCQSARSFINNMLYFARWLTCTCNLSEENSLFLRAISQKIEVIELSTIKYVAFLTDSKWSDLT